MRSEAPTESSPLPVKGQLFRSRFLWRPTMPLRILLADDHLIVRQGLKSLLEQENCTVVAEAGDGREAIQLAQKRSEEHTSELQSQSNLVCRLLLEKKKKKLHKDMKKSKESS